ncbi:polysaccharide biosynthesis protein [bacterium]|nr:polysaccharide biosynthesis protein [bacterium]
MAEGLPVSAPPTYGVPSHHLPGKLIAFQTLSSARYSIMDTSEPSPTKIPGATRQEKVKPAAGPMEQEGSDELSPIEQSLLADETTKEKSQPLPFRVQHLNQFGYNFFKPSAGGFSPLTDIPVGADYIVGPGDRIILNLWGSVEGSHELEVNRSGEIVLPKVGNVRVSGVPFGELPKVLKSSLSRIYKDFGLNVTMGKLRVVKVYVVGEVRAPGDYNLSSLSTLINALSAAGGPLKTGSLRAIQIKRAGKLVETVDLYDFFLSGDKSRDIRLHPGDTIFVPVIGRVAGISGNVKRPAIYELKHETNLFDLVGLAEGFLPTGYLQRIQLSRVDAHEKKVVADFNLDPKRVGKSPEEIMKAVKIQDMDLVKIFPIDTTLRDHVRLSGYVLRPGDYALKPGMRLSSLLPKDNLLPEFYREAAEITRLYPPDYHPEKMFVNLGKALANDPEHDLELKEFDEVKIFSRWDMEDMPKVRVNGEVQKPGEYRLLENMTVRDLLMEAGNLKVTAYRKFAELNRLKQTGEAVSSYAVTINIEEAMKGNPKDNLVLAPFDELSVRRIPNWSEEKERYVNLAGEVMFPGVYPIYKGEKLSSVIERAGGFTDKAYLAGARFTRESVRQTQQERMAEVIARTEQELLKKQGELAALAASKEELESTKASLEGLQKGLEKLKGAKAEGRMVLYLAQMPGFAKSEYNVELMGGDALYVPVTPNEVTVLGQVYNQTSLVYVKEKNASFYLGKAGGPTRDAEEDDMYIVRADGTVVSRHQSSIGFKWNNDTKSWYFGTFLSTQMQPGDTLVVPQRLERIAWMREIKDITTILGNIALTAGIIIAAGL